MSVSGGIPSYPSAGGPGDAPAALPAVPRVVTVSFWLYLLAALLGLVLTVINVVAASHASSRVRRVLEENSNVAAHHVNVSVVVAAGITVTVVVGVLFAAAYVVFALLLRRGHGWSRIVLLIVTVLSLVSVAGGHGLGLAREVAAIVATVLVFLRPAGEWFKAAREARAARLLGR